MTIAKIISTKQYYGGHRNGEMRVTEAPILLEEVRVRAIGWWGTPQEETRKWEEFTYRRVSTTISWQGDGAHCHHTYVFQGTEIMPLGFQPLATDIQHSS